MTRPKAPLLRFRLAAILSAFLCLLALAAYLGLQVHNHGLGGEILEWGVFLASLMACLALLAYGARLLGLPGPSGLDRDRERD